jgi:uncharacterized membrane protein YkoI
MSAYEASMIGARCLLAAACLAGACSTGASEPSGCLSQEQRRAVIASRQAVPLGRAIAAAKEHVSGEVVRARLCRHDKELVYVLIVLARDGKVTLATVDGASGAFIHAH